MDCTELKGLFQDGLISQLEGINAELTEIRIRRDKPVVAIDNFCRKHYLRGHIADATEIEHVIGVASGFSLYSVEEQLAGGYLTWGKGYRIGVSGEGVVRDGRLKTIKSITSLCVRIPHEVKGAADKLYKEYFADGLQNLLVISPTGRGKTTLIRDLARIIGANTNTVIVDERFEIAGAGLSLDTGVCSDVISGAEKSLVYQNVVRALCPELLIFDELFSEKDVETVIDVIRSGVKVVASLHARGETDLEQSRIFAPLLHKFDLLAVLSSVGKVGRLEFVKRLKC